MNMFIWYFLTVPDLPWEVVDQTRAVSIVRYLVPEGTSVEPGDAIAEVSTWWAELKITAKYRCWVEKTLFDNPAIQEVKIDIGQPIAMAFCDPVDSPGNDSTTQVEVVRFIRQKPKKS